ncbi:MAG: PilN domain-containing protein [Phycisphaerae bacterium]|nr:PilN domain-containing protein [Phycisphaerae bacterium]
MTSVNFIPDDVVLRQLRRVHLRRLAVMGGIAVALVLAAAAFDTWDKARIGALKSQVVEAESLVGALRVEVQKLAGQAGDLQLRIDRADALRSKREWSGVLALLSQTMPSGCWLTSVATVPPRPGRNQNAAVSAPAADEKQGAVRTSITIDAPRKLTLGGYAAEVAEPSVFVSRLKESGAFRDVSLVGTHRETLAEGPFFRFEVVCEW